MCIDKSVCSPTSALIISDDDHAIEDIEQLFSFCMPETNVITIDSYQSIAGRIKSLHPDLVILDLDGRRIDSFDMLLETKRNFSVPLFTLSYVRDETMLIKALEYGADVHLNKPLRQLELIAHVRAVMRRQKQIEVQRPRGKPV